MNSWLRKTYRVKSQTSRLRQQDQTRYYSTKGFPMKPNLTSARSLTGTRIPTRAIAATLMFLATCIPAASANGTLDNDYPTQARVDYVFGCMAANGETHEAMERCSAWVTATLTS